MSRDKAVEGLMGGMTGWRFDEQDRPADEPGRASDGSNRPLEQAFSARAEALQEALASLPAELALEAETHVSYSNEHGAHIPNNERLEFLGDAVLYLAVGYLLFQKYPKAAEGDLTRMRASLVSGTNLATVAAECGLGERLRLGRGEEATGGRTRPRILASALEAVVGAQFLEAGWGRSLKLIEDLLLVELHDGPDGKPSEVPVDAKTVIQERVQRAPGSTLEYRVVEVEGPDHAPCYTVACLVDGVEVSRGRGSSKKEAEEAAAANAMERGKV